MAKARPATWMEKEMMLDMLKNSGTDVNVDLTQCSYTRSSSGNLVCMKNGVPIFYILKNGTFALPPLDKNTSLRERNLKRLEKEQQKKNQKKASKKKKQSIKAEKREQQIQKESPKDIENRERWTALIEDITKDIKTTNIHFDIFPVFEKTLGATRMRIVVQPKPVNDIGTIEPRQISPQKWTNDLIREKINHIVNTERFDIMLNKDVERIIKHSVVNYIKNNQSLAIDSALVPLMPNADFYKCVRLIQKNTGLIYNATRQFEIQKPSFASDGLIRFYICGVGFACSPDGEWLKLKKENNFQNAVTFANAHKNNIKACIHVMEEFNKNNTISFSAHMSLEIDPASKTLDAKIIFEDGMAAQSEVFSENEISAKRLSDWSNRLIEYHEEGLKKQDLMEKERLYRLPLYGNMLVVAALKLIRRNEGKITAKALTKNLTTSEKNVNVKSIPESGKFKLISPEEVDNIVDKLIGFGFVEVEKVGHERVLVTTDAGREFARLEYPKSRLQKLQFDHYSDMDWLEYVKQQNENGNFDRLAEETCILEHKNLFMLFPEEIKEFVKKVPREWIEYADMMKDLAEGKEKEFWSYVKKMWMIL